MLSIGIDVGGTFTDLVAIDAAGRTVFAKSISTVWGPAPQSPEKLKVCVWLLLFDAVTAVGPPKWVIERRACSIGVHPFAIGFLGPPLDRWKQPKIDVHRLIGFGLRTAGDMAK